MSLTTFSQYYTNHPMYDRMNDGDSWLGPIMMLLFIVIVTVAIILVIKSTNSNPADSDKKPIDIAKERFAKGEITKDQLAEIKKELK